MPTEQHPRRGAPATPDPQAVAAVAVADDARVVLLGKPGCHLCDDARVVVEAVCAERGEPYVERSTLDDVAWEMAYWEKIPVLFVDGHEVSHWFVDRQVLRDALARRDRAGPVPGPGDGPARAVAQALCTCSQRLSLAGRGHPAHARPAPEPRPQPAPDGAAPELLDGPRRAEHADEERGDERSIGPS